MSGKALGLIITIAIIVPSLFWWSYRQNGLLRAELREAVVLNPLPPTLNGFKLSLLGTQPIGQSLIESAPSSRTLLFVSSDNCTACRAMLPAVKQLLAKLPLAGTDRVINVSYLGEGIPIDLQELANRRGFRFATLRVVEQETFSHVTGVRSTPQLIVLDRDSRVRLLTNKLDEAVSRAVLEAWNELSIKTGN